MSYMAIVMRSGASYMFNLNVSNEGYRSILYNNRSANNINININ